MQVGDTATESQFSIQKKAETLDYQTYGEILVSKQTAEAEEFILCPPDLSL